MFISGTYDTMTARGVMLHRERGYVHKWHLRHSD